MNGRISNNEPRIEVGREPGSGVRSSAFSFSFPRWRAGLVLTLLLFAGCHRVAPAGPAEHHTPAHKPASYPAAVERLGELHQQIVGGRAGWPVNWTCLRSWVTSSAGCRIPVFP